MGKPDYAALHNEIKKGNENETLLKVMHILEESFPLEEILQYFYDFLDYIIKFGEKELQKPIRQVIDKLHEKKYLK